MVHTKSKSFRALEIPSRNEQQDLDKLNQLLAQIIPDINAGIRPDTKALAEQSGIDEDSINHIVDDLKQRVGR